MNERGIVEAARSKPTAAEQTAYLDEACAGDAALRQRVESLLHTQETSSISAEGQGGAHPAPDVTSAFDSATDVQEDAGAGRPGPSETAAEPTLAPEAARPEQDLAFLEPSEQPNSLGRLAHYEIRQVLGKGGFGTVLKAFDEKLCRLVAIKVLGAQLAGNPTARKRFVREARAAAAVRDEHVVKVYDVEERPRPYLVMEYVDGPTLQDLVDRDGALPVELVLRIGAQVAHGLASAHRQGQVHRDIKPANILLARDEGATTKPEATVPPAGPSLTTAQRHLRFVAKITDFGLARAIDDVSLTQSGVIAGTPMYMSPEQARGEPVDHRSDLFSLGSVLYTLCAGQPPFRAASTLGVLKRVCDDTLRPLGEVNPSVPSWLAAIVGKLQQKGPADRIQTADELAELLEQGLAHLRDSAAPPPWVDFPLPAEAMKTPSARKPGLAHLPMWQWALGVGLIGVILGVGGLLVYPLVFPGQSGLSPSGPGALVPAGPGQRMGPNGRAGANIDPATIAEIERALEQGNLHDATVSARALTEREPNDAAAHLTLGMLLALQENLDEAAVAFRRASELAPDAFMAHSFLGLILVQQGKVEEAVTVLRRANELHPGNAEIQQALAKAERLVSAQANLDRFLKNEYAPGSTDERLALASLCVTRRLYRTAVRLYSDAFAADPRVAEDLNSGNRYNAACCAAQGGAGQGPEATALDDGEKARLRKQARDWLRADLTAIVARSKEAQNPTARRAFSTLQHWQGDPDLAGIRDEATLRTLPAAESQECRQLWEEVEKVQVSLEPKATASVRIRAAVRRADWPGVKALLTQSLEANPANHDHWCYAADLAAFRGEVEEYARCRAQLLQRYGQTSDPIIAERTAKACLVLPPDPDILAQVERLADRAVEHGETGHWIAPYAQFVRGFAEYRRGNYEAAEAWLQKALRVRAKDWVVAVPAQLVLAMTQHQRGQAKVARETLAQAITFLNTKATNASEPALGPNWPDWLAYQVIRREAEALIEGKKDVPRP